MILALLFFGFCLGSNSFTYNVTSSNEDRALLALESSPYIASYGSLALNETFPNIVYYIAGLDAGVLSIKLNAFINNTRTNDRVFINSTIIPERLVEYDEQGNDTDNQIRFADTSTGWGPIGTGIISLSYTSLIKELLDSNATLINVLWTGPQQNELGQNVTAQFSIFIAPAIEAMGRMFMNQTSIKNVTGIITALTVKNFPFKASQKLALRNIVKMNETVYIVDEPISSNLNKTVALFSPPNNVLSSRTLVDRNILNLVRNFSRNQLDEVVVIEGSTGNANETILVEGLMVNLKEMQNLLPNKNSGTQSKSRPCAMLVPLILGFCLALSL